RNVLTSTRPDRRSAMTRTTQFSAPAAQVPSTDRPRAVKAGGGWWRGRSRPVWRARPWRGLPDRSRAGGERGDVPGWVLITIMTAGLVIAIWALAGPQLEIVFNESIQRILNAGP